MNRADRRAARRSHARDHSGCDCTPRRLRPVELEITCPACGVTGPTPDTLVLPTMAEPGTLKTVYASCSCGDEVEVQFLVEDL